MLKIGDKTFLNLQEAVGWLMANNALPFQCTENYAADTEIPLSDLVNPGPAKVRIGSIVFFADAKAATVTGITSTSFTVGADYIDLDQNPHVTNVAIDASGHLITTLSDGSAVDAGLVKQVSGFSISASQHLIASFNDGTTQDLGAIFAGDVTISGALRATTVEQSQPNFTRDLSNVTLIPSANFSVNVNQSKVEAINGVLYISVRLIIECVAKTNPDSNEYLNHIIIPFTLPTSISAKVTDVKGVPVSENGHGNVIGRFFCFLEAPGDGFIPDDRYFILRNTNTPDQITCQNDTGSGYVAEFTDVGETINLTGFIVIPLI